MNEKQIAAMKLALEALKANKFLVNGDEKNGGLVWCMDGYYSDCFDIDPINEQTDAAITALTAALADNALDKMAENERELGIQMQPTGKQHLQVEGPLHVVCQCDQCKAQQEPVAWGNLANWCLDSDRVLITDKAEAAKYHRDVYDLTPLYTRPQAREPLSRGLALKIVEANPDIMTAIRMTEAAHQIGVKE